MNNLEFDKVHGTKVESGNWFLYSDGASREQSAYGLQNEPPDDSLERSKKQKRFWELRLQEVSRQFRTLKADAERTIRNGRSPSDEDLRRLEELKAEALTAQEFLGKFDEEEDEEDDREYEAAIVVFKERAKLLKEKDRLQRKIDESNHRGTMAIWRKASKEIGVLRIAINKLHRQWSGFSGRTRHRIQEEEEARKVRKANKRLESIEI